MSVVADILLVLALALALVLAVVVTVFLAQVVAFAARRRVASIARTPGARGSVAVLVPAHNEQAGIERTIAAVLPQLGPLDRLLVVADNCDDRTAAVARAAGAEVVERASELRGKGYALAFGVDALRERPPGAVVILDADCDLAPGALDAMLADLKLSNRPVQSLYLMLAPDAASLAQRLAEFAWRVRNHVRPAGAQALGLACQLMGTGMAFSWSMLREAPLANASIVEDMKLGIDLALAGQPPIFCERALVTSRFPESTAATSTQRTRWEHGHLEMILREVPRMLAGAARRADRRLLGMALDLAVPPLALLAGLLLADSVLALLAWAFGAGASAVVVAALLLAAFAAAVLAGWAQRGRDLVSGPELLSVPLYIARKVPLYARFLVRRQKAWVRTDRE